MGKITESTVMPISMVIALAGGIIFCTTFYNEQKAIAQVVRERLATSERYEREIAQIHAEIKAVSDRQDRQGKVLAEILQRVRRY